MIIRIERFLSLEYKHFEEGVLKCFLRSTSLLLEYLDLFKDQDLMNLPCFDLRFIYACSVWKFVHCT